MSRVTASTEGKSLRGSRKDASLLIAVTLCASLTSACAVRSPPELRTSQGSPTGLSALDLLAPDNEQSQRVAMHAALTDALSDQGVSISSGAPAVGEFSISSGDAGVGLYVSEAGETALEPRPVAEARKARWLDLCTPVRVQASLAVFDRASGSLVKRSSAHGTICEGDETPYANLAAILTENLLSR